VILTLEKQAGLVLFFLRMPAGRKTKPPVPPKQLFDLSREG